MQNLETRYVCFLIINCFVDFLKGQPVPQKFSVLQEAIADVSYWTYGNNNHGQRHWAALFRSYCAGRHQSPINIQTEETIYDPTLKEFAIFYDPPAAESRFEVHNNGHAVEVNTVGKFYVSNGGLKHLYQTAQFHFHWGRNSLRGSEHTVDGLPAPIEMHVVNWNRELYRSADEAAKHPEGLAVFSILFEISKEDNPKLETIVTVLQRVRDPDKHALIRLPAVSIKEFLPKSPERYFRYSGSLTTPNCSETVIWTVFQQKQTISERQLYYFRKMLTSSLHLENRSQRQLDLFRAPGATFQTRVPLIDNFRPVQNMNGRKVYRSFPELGAPTHETCDIQIGFRVKVHT